MPSFMGADSASSSFSRSLSPAIDSFLRSVRPTVLLRSSPDDLGPRATWWPALPVLAQFRSDVPKVRTPVKSSSEAAAASQVGARQDRADAFGTIARGV